MASLKSIIEQLDRIRPNEYTNEEKTQWVSNIEVQIAKEIFGATVSEYDWVTDQEETLLLEAPYEDVYIFWLLAQIDFHNGEFNRYNNELGNFHERLSDAQATYIRERRPAKRKFRWFP